MAYSVVQLYTNEAIWSFQAMLVDPDTLAPFDDEGFKPNYGYADVRIDSRDRIFIRMVGDPGRLGEIEKDVKVYLSEAEAARDAAGAAQTGAQAAQAGAQASATAAASSVTQAQTIISDGHTSVDGKIAQAQTVVDDGQAAINVTLGQAQTVVDDGLVAVDGKIAQAQTVVDDGQAAINVTLGQAETARNTAQAAATQAGTYHDDQAAMFAQTHDNIALVGTWDPVNGDPPVPTFGGTPRAGFYRINGSGTLHALSVSGGDQLAYDPNTLAWYLLGTSGGGGGGGPTLVEVTASGQTVPLPASPLENHRVQIIVSNFDDTLVDAGTNAIRNQVGETDSIVRVNRTWTAPVFVFDGSEWRIG